MGIRPRPYVAIWPRGHAKSTGAELACVRLAHRRRRRYGLYVAGTQDKADDHVQNVAALLESPRLETVDPALCDRALSKYGTSKGWRHNRLRTRSGFTLDAAGLDRDIRGLKHEEQRPDLIILDDVDGTHDSAESTRKKLDRITRDILPAGASDVAVVAIQNLVHPASVFARLAGVAEEPADFLLDRIVSGPHPAVRDLQVELREGRYVITGGEPTWEGPGLALAQEQINEWGLSAFLSEAQHEVEAPAGGMFDHLDFEALRVAQAPTLARGVVFTDPAVTDTDQSDANGIQCDGIGTDGLIYRLASWERRASPLETLKRAIMTAEEHGANSVGVETDQGGDTWASVYRQAAIELGYLKCPACGRLDFQECGHDPAQVRRPPAFMSAKAGASGMGKTERAARMLADYERGGIRHVGPQPVLERALRRFPRTKPYDLVDAAYWSWRALRTASGGRQQIETSWEKR